MQAPVEIQSRSTPGRSNPPPATRMAHLDRPLTDSEWHLVRTFVHSMQRADLRLRFGYPLDFQYEPTLRRTFDNREGLSDMVWALDISGAIAGIVHRVMISDREAELGLMVRSDLQRRGVGEGLLREILALSAKTGLNTLSAFVERDNRAMLNLAAKVGFEPKAASTWTLELALDVSARAQRPTVTRTSSDAA
jgi:acetyltransferase